MADSTSAVPGQDRSSELVAISISFIVLTTLVLILRFYAKRYQDGGFFADDALLIAAYVDNLGMCAVGIIMTQVGGVGKHVTYLEETNPAALVGWARCLLAFEFIYFTSIALPKLSILFLYLRIFNWTGRIRQVAWVILALTAMTSVALDIATVFQCRPLAYWWDTTIEGGTCFDVQIFFHAQAIPGCLLDVSIMALPVGTIWNLRLPMIKRLALLGIFIVASFGIVASIVRASVFYETSAFDDRTWASVDLVGWSIIETGVYIITCCLPHLKPLVSRWTPDFIKSVFRSSIRNLSGGTSSKGPSAHYGMKSFASGKKNVTGKWSEIHEDDVIELRTKGSAWSEGPMLHEAIGVAPTHSTEVQGSPPPSVHEGSSRGHKKDLSYGIVVTREVKLSSEREGEVSGPS